MPPFAFIAYFKAILILNREKTYLNAYVAKCLKKPQFLQKNRELNN